MHPALSEAAPSVELLINFFQVKSCAQNSPVEECRVPVRFKRARWIARHLKAKPIGISQTNQLHLYNPSPKIRELPLQFQGRLGVYRATSGQWIELARLRFSR
jgi:hypothetical protein